MISKQPVHITMRIPSRSKIKKSKQWQNVLFDCHVKVTFELKALVKEQNMYCHRSR